MPSETLDDLEDGLGWLIEAAESKNEYHPPEVVRVPREHGGGTLPGNRPGDDFNRRAGWEDVLKGHGWHAVGQSGQKVLWRRPGKDHGWSATTGHCRSELRGDLLYVFSTSAPPFEAEQAYSKFEAYTYLEHNGDWSWAAEALGAAGWGTPAPRVRVTLRPGTPEPPPRPNADTSDDPLDLDATAADLIAANATIRWAWEGWLPIGVLTILASEPGVGKTRFCADLLRRVYHGLPWPDGTPPTLPVGSCALWVPADNQHAELGSMPGAFGFPPEALYLNATRRNPFTGTMLDGPADLKDFEARIHRVCPALVFIDTSLNATDRTAHRPEDAKAFFKPLQEIAARAATVLMCVTHLNAAGKPLGRRVEGQGRVVVMMSKPDEEQPNRRRLWVKKSNSLLPVPLGITMKDDGNDYDNSPPSPPEEAVAAPRPGPASRLSACKVWLEDQLSGTPQKVADLIVASDAAGFGRSTLYAARDAAGAIEETIRCRKYWRLPRPDEQE